ncbi:MAG TPA: geranylgeranyl reductase family protein [Gaiellaceae bacterium]|nr:geranylgeranyl reductase family protein [Gaiellaceae bacterium]
MTYDVAILGGGPAGSTAAYRLATAGARVLLLDKATFPRDKPCGGGVTGRAARLLPFSIEPVVEDAVDRLECGLRYRRRFTRHARAPLAYMTQRRRLDHFLLQKAAEAGAEVREGETADVRELDARIVIGADGCNGSSAKQLELADGVVHGVALEANYPHEPRFARAMVLEIAVIRGGYGWVFPKGDHVNVGVGGNGEEGPKLRAELRRMCEAYGIDPDAAEDTRGYRLPLRLPGTLLARGRTAVIGDAAGLVDPFSGDGMYEAFLSAQLVADAALDVLAGRAENLDAYQAAVERRIAPLTRAGWGAKRAFERFPRTTYALARLPVTFRALEKLLRGELSEPAAARGVERAAIRAIYAVSRAGAGRRVTAPGSRSAASS